MRLLVLAFLLLFSVALLASCAAVAGRHSLVEERKEDPLEKHRQELRKDFEDFLKRAREIQERYRSTTPSYRRGSLLHPVVNYR